MLSQAGKIQTTNRGDRGCTAAKKHRLSQPFSLMELVYRGPAIWLETDDDADGHPEETRNEHHPQETLDRGDPTH
jgi:hypothetical protein